MHMWLHLLPDGVELKQVNSCFGILRFTSDEILVLGCLGVNLVTTLV